MWIPRRPPFACGVVGHQDDIWTASAAIKSSTDTRRGLALGETMIGHRTQNSHQFVVPQRRFANRRVVNNTGDRHNRWSTKPVSILMGDSFRSDGATAPLISMMRFLSVSTDKNRQSTKQVSIFMSASLRSDGAITQPISMMRFKAMQDQ